MAREVSVKITANTSGFNSGMDQAGSKAAQTAAKIKASFDSGLTGISKNSRSINALSSGLGKVGIIAAVGFGAAIKSAADFDQAMSSVAATGSDARANMSALRDAAIKAGADTKFSATEAAGGVEALAKAGVSAKDTLGGGLTGALNLAAAGNLDVGASAEVAASAMNQFGLAGKDIPHIADLLAQGAGVAQGEVSDMAAALQQSGLVANQFGLSIDETAQSLSLFAKNGLVGSDAGTSFKTMLTSLYAPTSTGAKALGELGVSAYDAAGQLKPIGVLADDLKGKLDGLTAQDRNAKMRAIFGSDAIRAGTILLKDGSAGLSNMATEFGKFGSAADVARTKMDNLKGDLEQLKGSFETALIGLGEGGTGPLRSLTQGLTGAVNSFNKLGSGTKGAILAIGGIGAASALGVAGVLRLATGAAEAYTAFGKLSTNLPRLSGALRGLGTAVAAVGVTLVALQGIGAISRQLKANFVPDVEASNNALDQLASTGSKFSIDDLFKYDTETGIKSFSTDINGLDQAFAKMKAPTALEQVREQVDKVTGTTGGLTTIKTQFAALDEQLSRLSADGQGGQAAKAFTQIAQSAADAGVSVDQLKGIFPQYAQSIRDITAANGGNITSTQQLVDVMSGKLPAGATSTASALDSAGSALAAIGASSSGAVADLNSLTTAMFATANAALGVSDAQIGFEQAVDAAAAASKKNGDNLRVSTAAGRENRTALNQLAASGQKYVQSLVDQGASVKRVKSATEDARSSFIKSATDMGMSGAAARKLANSYGLVPKNITTTVDAKAGTAKAELAKVKAAVKDLPKSQQVQVISAYKSGGIEAAQAKLKSLKDKTVTATAKGNSQGAIKVDQAMKRLDDRTVTANTKGNTGGAKSVDKAMRALKDRLVKAQARGDASGARAVQSAMNALHDKTVTARIITRRETIVTKKTNDVTGPFTGGLITPGGVMFRSTAVHRSNGGAVWGAGSATSDSIPAMLSNGEFVINAKSVRAIGVNRLAYANQNGELPKFAKGGVAGSATGGPVGLTTDREVLRAVTAQFHVDQARNLAERRKADVELAKAMKKLNDTQSAALDSIKSLSTSLQEPYRSKSTDVDDVLAAMKDGAKDISAFGSQVKQLKAMGLQQGVIDQITADGAVNGGELAGQILAGGQGLVDALNKANDDLTKAGTALGKTSVGLVQDAPAGKPKKTPKKKALGGYLDGPGSGTSDSIPLLASNGEYVVNAAATAANRSVLDAINYGRAQINEHRFMPAYAGGHSMAPQQVDRSFHEGSMVLQYQGDLERGLRLAQAAKRDNLTMARLTGAV